MPDLPAFHGWTHRPKAQGGTDPIPEPAQFDIKVFGDTAVTAAGDGKFIFAVPSDLDTTRLISADGYLTTEASTDTDVQIRNVTQATDMLNDKIRIDGGDTTSYTSADPSVVSAGLPVATGDLIAIDVDDDGGGDGMGLGVILTFA